MALFNIQNTWERRIDQCVSLGLQYDFHSQSYTKDDFNVAMVEIKTLSENEWKILIKKIGAEMKRRNVN